MISIKSFYFDNLHISPADLADFAERNRFRTYCMCCISLLMSILYLVLLFTLFHSNLRDNISHFIFIGICIFVTLISLCLSILFKNVSAEKAFICKNIPVYLVFCWGIGSGSYNSYIQHNPLLGIMNFFLSGLLLLCVFYVLLLPFFLIILSGFFGMFFSVYRTFDFLGLYYFVLITLILLSLSVVLKFRQKQYLTVLKKQKKSLEVICFGNFTPLYDKKIIKFSRSKSTELLAYLVYKNGSSVNTRELLSILYGEHADSEHYGVSLRQLISDIKHTFSSLEIQDFFITEHNSFRINPEVVQCDYYDFLVGKPQARNIFTGEFMNQYSWAEDTAAFLTQKTFALSVC